LADGRYDFAFDSNRWIDEQQADPASAGLVFAWATTPKMLARLAGFAKLEGLWGGDGGRKNQPGIAALHGLRVLRLNGATGDDLGFLAKLAELRILGLDSLKTASLRGLEGLQRLECLVIDHAPKITSLEPIATLGELRHLSISTPASWDASRRCIEVATLAPLGELTRLESLTLRGAGPRPMACARSSALRRSGPSTSRMSRISDSKTSRAWPARCPRRPDVACSRTSA
jgi:hypothetical protein